MAAGGATWQFLDSRSEVHGPYTAAQILSWNATYRYFHDDTKVRSNIREYDCLHDRFFKA
jgi:hypothetical protein